VFVWEYLGTNVYIRIVNNVTKSDSFPIPRIDDCIDKIGRAKYVTKFDLLKGFYQVPPIDRAKEMSAFVPVVTRHTQESHKLLSTRRYRKFRDSLNPS
jgi:hypothetical protein